MHLRKLLPVSLLIAGASAQSLIYDNGPIANYNGLGVLQTTTTATPPAPTANFHTVFGFGVNSTALVTVADDFSIAAGGGTIQEVELFYYQTGASSANPGTCTGVFLEILNNAPTLGGLPVAGSPGFTNNLIAATVTHAFTGVYKVQDVAQTATNRPIFAIKVALPAPVVLTSGVYYLQWAMTGSLASGPWCPPVSTLDQPVTGNAEQQVGTAAWAGIVSGSPTLLAQGLPFRLYGGGGTPGTITNLGGACGTTGITVEGSPNTGGYIRTKLTGVVGTGIIGYSFNITSTPFCGCTFAHGWDFQSFATTESLAVPQNVAFMGLPVGVQGVDFGATGGCPIGFTLTDGIRVLLNN